MTQRETVFTIEATPISYGPGAAADAGWELARLGVRRALPVTDPGVAAAGHAERVRASIAAAGIAVVVFDGARVEPTLESLEAAAEFARAAGVDGFVSVGGGSAIHTAKVADLGATHPEPVVEYVNAPHGGGRRPPAPLLPHLAIPTTSGTGSECTTVAVLDIPELRVKTGDERPPYQGSNPVADVWAAKALEHGGRFLRRAVAGDGEARAAMMLAATAGIGFGSAGVHIPHACAYPIAGLARGYQAPGYPSAHPFVPHGQSMIVTAPAAFRFTYEAAPERHHRVAELLAGAPLDAPGPESLPDVLRELASDVGAPSGLSPLGFGEADVAALAAAAYAQQRLLAVAPRPVTERDLASILHASL